MGALKKGPLSFTVFSYQSRAQKRHRLERLQGLLLTCLTKGDTIIENYVQESSSILPSLQEVLRKYIQSDQLRSLMAVPIEINGKVRAILTLLNKGGDEKGCDFAENTAPLIGQILG